MARHTQLHRILTLATIVGVAIILIGTTLNRQAPVTSSVLLASHSVGHFSSITILPSSAESSLSSSSTSSFGSSLSSVTPGGNGTGGGNGGNTGGSNDDGGGDFSGLIGGGITTGGGGPIPGGTTGGGGGSRPRPSASPAQSGDCYSEDKLHTTCIPLIQPLGSRDRLTVKPGAETFIDYFNDASSLLLTVAIGFCVLWILIGSYCIMVSGSDGGKRSTGTSMITWAIIGLIIVNFAGFFLRTLNSIFFV